MTELDDLSAWLKAKAATPFIDAAAINLALLTDFQEER